MYIDKQNMLSAAQTVTTGSGSGIVSENGIDLGSAGRDIGVGQELYVVVDVETTLADSGSNSEVTVSLVHADDAALTSNVAAVQTIGTFPAVSVKGSRLIARIQPGVITKRYIGVRYVSSNGDLSAGKFNAQIVQNIDAFKAYADNITIS